MTTGRFLSYAFVGSGGFAARCLHLLSEWRLPSWIVTAPPKPAGRGNRIAPTPVESMILETPRFEGVPLVRSAAASRDERVLGLKRGEGVGRVDVVFVTDFGQLIKEPLLSRDEPIGCLNIHPSMLPRYRGAAPIQRVLMDGLCETGVTIFKLVEQMDSGPILLQRKISIEETDDTGSLLDRAATVGVDAFVEYASGTPLSEWRFAAQDDSLATYAPKIDRAEERIDWSAHADSISFKIRALAPKPGAWTTIRGKRLRILEARPEEDGRGTSAPGTFAMSREGTPLVRTGNGLLALCSVQMEGRKIQPASEWWRGLRAGDGECLV